MVPKDESDYKAVASYYVGLTFSHVCTCTIFKKSNNFTWNFFQHTNPEYASHISIGLPKIAKVIPYKNKKIILNYINLFI